MWRCHAGRVATRNFLRCDMKKEVNNPVLLPTHQAFGIPFLEFRGKDKHRNKEQLNAYREPERRTVSGDANQVENSGDKIIPAPGSSDDLIRNEK